MKKSIILIIALILFYTNFKLTETKNDKKNLLILKEDQMVLTSSSYSNNSDIPAKYCRQQVTDGQNISPHFKWSGAPQNTKSFVLIIVDHHPIASDWVHWLVVNIPPNVDTIPEGASKTDKMPPKSKELINTFGFRGYDGPQPPKGTGKHNYDAIIYALSIPDTNLNGKISEAELLRKIEPYILDSAQLTGYFGR
jgi:hypothetical protein